MFSSILIDNTTRNMLIRYLSGDKDNCLSLVLYGDRGIGKRLIAESVAKWFLELPDALPLSSSRDFYAVHAGKQMSFKDQMSELRELASTVANRAKRRVFLIDDAETVDQNLLLKILEDQVQQSVFILVAHQELLSTIYSRCIKITVTTPTIDMLKSFLSAESQDIDDVSLACSGGKIGLYKKFKAQGKLFERATLFLDVFNKMINKRDLLVACNALKEKDDQYLFTVLGDEEREGFLNLLKCIFRINLSLLSGVDTPQILYLRPDLSKFYDLSQTLTILNVLDRHMLLLKRRKGLYSKNDFFDLIITLLE